MIRESSPHTAKQIAKLVAKKRTLSAYKARSDFSEFALQVGTDHTGKKMALDVYSRVTIAVLHRAFEEGRHFAQVSPPGLGKSTCARLYMLWRIGKAPILRTVVIGGDMGGSVDNVSACRQILLSNEYRSVFPEARPDYERSMAPGARASDKRDGRGWRNDSWFLQAAGQRKDPTMQAVAAIPHREDMRVDILLADDIVTELIANSAAERQAIERTFWATWMEGRLSNGGQCIYLQNLRRQGDLAHTLRDDSRFVSMWVGVQPDLSGMFVRLWNASPRMVELIEAAGGADIERVEPLDGAAHEWEFALPDAKRFPKFAPAALASMNARARRQLYFLQPGNPEDALLPQFADFKKAGRFAPGLPGAAFGLIHVGSGVFMPPLRSWENIGVDVIGGLDWSSGKRRGKALTLVARQRSTGALTPIFHQRIKGELSDVVALLNKLWAIGVRWQLLLLEDNGMQDEMNIIVRRDAPPAWRPLIKDFHTDGRNKFDPIRGLSMLGTLLETGGFLWPALAQSVSPDWAMLEAELTDTTADQVTHAGKTPDGLMSLWFPMHHLTSAPPISITEPLRTAGAPSSGRRHGGY